MKFTSSQMSHPYIIDTAAIYNISGNKNPSKLKVLSEIFLKKQIQRDDVVGHDAAEDALAAIELVQLKLQRGSY